MPERLLLINSVFDGHQIKTTKKKPQLILTSLKVVLREKVKSCDHTGVGWGGRSLIFLAAPTGSAKREQGKMEKKGKTEMYYSTSVMTINI